MQRLKNVPGMLFLLALSLSANGQTFRYMERLDRGIVAVSTGSNGVFIGWRRFGIDPEDIGFNIYRDGIKINASPITGGTNYTDTAGNAHSTYSIRPVLGGIEQAATEPVGVWASQHLDIPLQVPAGVTTPDGVTCSYSPNDCSVGDLDGDGQYEIVLKWDPSNSRDNGSQDLGYSGNAYLDAYELDGTFLWRIDLGINIRAGAHYTQFMVYDLDSDGKAEVACKTAPYTVDGLGNHVLIPGDVLADYRNTSGMILSGPEYLTIFDGQTGAEMVTTDYVPSRGNVSDWGDNYGNRVDRFLACVAYLDGQHPSLVMCRGYYTRAVLAAWDLVNGQLVQRWVFDSDNGYSSYGGQGNHNLSVADVDGDDFDEIVYGSCAIDHDGTGLYSTGLGHGDALHVTDMDPGRPGLEVWQCHESSPYGASFRDAGTGEIIFRYEASKDTGRACAGDITGTYGGYEVWASTGVPLTTCTGTNLGGHSLPINFMIWWDGDLSRELLDGTTISKYGSGALLSASSCFSNNGSKSTPCLTADILGDWREEVIFRTSDNAALRIFTTTVPTIYPGYTLMHDPQYRLSIAWQNVGYNQPPHTGFYFGSGMSAPPRPQIQYAGSSGGLLREWWTNITGPNVSDLTANAAYPDSPSGSSVLQQFQGPSSWADATGTRLRGWLIPPADGSYTFWVAADDSAELWLSSDATAANAALAAYVGTWTDPLEWDKYAWQQSPSLTLEAGHKYYIELLHKDDSGDDHFAVAWQGPGLARQVITGDYLRPWAAYLAGDVTGNALVDLEDLSLISAQWAQVDCDFDLHLDANGDCQVNLPDLMLSAENWLLLSEETVRIQENEPGFVYVDGTVDSNNAGFTGTGFANTYNSAGAYIEWHVYAPRAGGYDLQWRFANGTTINRSGTVTVNGAAQAAGVSFGPTGDWTTWTLSSSVTVQLQQGGNLIRLVADVSGQGLANIDWMDVTGLAPQGVSQ